MQQQQTHSIMRQLMRFVRLFFAALHFTCSSALVILFQVWSTDKKCACCLNPSPLVSNFRWIIRYGMVDYVICFTADVSVDVSNWKHLVADSSISPASVLFTQKLSRIIMFAAGLQCKVRAPGLCCHNLLSQTSR